jgi:hypothetical protein
MSASKEFRLYPAEELNPRLERLYRYGLAVGLIGLVILLVGAILTGFDSFFQAYLFSYLFWLELSLGPLAVALLHYLVGGGWGLMIRRVLEAAARNVWLMAILFIPILIGVRYLYPWAQPEVVATDAILQHRTPYLNLPFFIIRAVIYFGVWIFLLLPLTRWSNRPETFTDIELRSRVQRRSALGLILFGLTMTFAAVDWLKSVDAHWYSSIYPLLVITAQMLAGLALGIALTPFLARRTPLGEFITRNHYRDLGAMLLAFVMGWAYIGYSQYLIIWGANLPHETPWYIIRSQGGWGGLGVLVFVGLFGLPFLALISLWVKRNPPLLASIAFGILFFRLLDTYWNVMPAFYPQGVTVPWMALVAPLALGGLWVGMFAWNLKRTPLALPVEHPAEGHAATPKESPPLGV